MSKKRLIVSMLTMLLPFCFVGKAEAYYYGNDCCEARCCGCISITPRIGVAPAVYGCTEDRLVEYATTEFFETDGCVLDGELQTELSCIDHHFSFPRFHDQFEFPWQVGIEIEYNPSECVGLFIDINYTQARGKSHRFDLSDTITFPTTCTIDGPETISFDFTDEFREEYDDLKEVQGYIGCRYYSPRYCGAALFFGSKIGVKYRNSLEYRLKIRETTEGEEGEWIDHGEFQYFDNNLTFSGGFHIGLEYQISPCCSVVLMGEAVASGCYKTKDRELTRTFVTESTEDESDDIRYVTSRTITGGNAATVINFPITIGTQLSF